MSDGIIQDALKYRGLPREEMLHTYLCVIHSLVVISNPPPRVQTLITAFVSGMNNPHHARKYPLTRVCLPIFISSL